ncbi:MAG: hypothetical protein ACOYIP_01260 [Coriobacteriales bacterium]|jgi:ABC-2 type transport system permease protein
MQFTTSFFNPTLFKYSLRRFWPLAVAVFVVVMLFPGIAIFNAPAFSMPGQAASYVVDIVDFAIPVMVVLVAPAALLSALLVFDHLRKRSKIRFYHGLPLTRLSSFVTRYVCGFALVAVPLVVGLLVCMGMAASVGASQAIPAIVRLIGFSLLCLLLFLGMASVACIVCGNVLGSILVYIAMNCVVVVILLGFGALISALLPGIDIATLIEGPARWWTPMYQLITGLWHDADATAVMGGAATTIPPVANPRCIVVYLIVGIVLLVLAAWLYRIRKDESAGETVAFKAVRVICKVLLALVVSAIGATTVVAVGYAGGDTTSVLAPVLVAHIIFAIVGWLIAEMIVGRTLRAVSRRSLLSCLILAVAILAVTGLLRADVLGVVHKVPDPQKVEKVQVAYNGRDIAMDPADAAALHTRLVEAYDEDTTSGGWPYGLYSDSTVSFSYTMANGSVMHRSYTVSYNEDQPSPAGDIMADALATPRYTHEMVFGVEPGTITAENISYATVNIATSNESNASGVEYTDDGEVLFETYSFEGKNAYGLYQAVLEDIEKGNTDSRILIGSRNYLGDVDFSFNAAANDGKVSEHYANISIAPDMTVTREWIDAHKGEAEQA